ncbi:hypothetical protein PQQ99_13190 [Paraburkholderia sediminicola]|uniref:hypothetical protein n=1 Tax=Paraburkholderia sediminicola TaxID=458836 RepID=UPI0038BBAB4C
MLIPIRQYAEDCAATHICATPAYAAEALHCSPDTASAALRDAVSAGLFRRLLLPGLGNKPVYQPTAKAAGVDARRAPRFFRAGIGEAPRWRGLLRAGVIGQNATAHTFLPVESARELCDRHAIPLRGYEEPLLARDGAGPYRTYACVPPQAALESAAGFVERTILRWSAWLQDGGLELHFATLAGRAAEAMQMVLAEYGTPAHGAMRELVELDARIASDRTGTARIRLANRRAELAALAAVESNAAFPWLVTTVTEVRV